MTIADEARDNALHCEMVKYAYRQTKDGVVVSFVVHPNDIPAALSVSHIGARYMVALVQIGDDELPIPPTAKGIKTFTAAPAKPSLTIDRPSEKAKREWRELQPSAQAGLRCSEPIFWAYLREELKMKEEGSADNAASFVRAHCKVNSRAHFNSNPAAKAVWQSLDSQFQAWKAMQQ